MTNKFTPINYLNEKDRLLLKETRKKIKEAETLEEIRNYKTILDLLLEKSAENYNKQNKNQKELQYN